MDRNNMRSSYMSGPRSLPHMGKRHANGHSGNGHSGNGHSGNGHSGNGHSGNGHSGNGHARLSPPAPPPSCHQHDDLINYIYDSWNKVTRDLERGGQDARYYQEVVAPRQLANFRPFNFDDWWGRRKLQIINRQNHRSS